MKAIAKEHMAYPDMSEVADLMMQDGRCVVALLGLLYDGKPDEARDILYRWTEKWAQELAEMEMNS